MHYILLRQLDVDPSTPILVNSLGEVLAQKGFQYLLFTMLVISVSDIAAYYIGKRFGKNLLSPEISPKKTKEGAVGGGIVAILAGVAFSMSVGFPVKHAVILGLILVVVGQMGDLAESLMKRDSGMKDSSAMLGGHGGFMDRADSYIFSGAVSYYYIQWLINHQGLPVEVIRWLRQIL